MVRKSVRTRLHDIREAIDGIRETIAGADFETYARTWHLRRATERGIEIISEASRHIPDDLKARFPGTPWQDIASIGNLLRHEYAKVDDRIIWNVTRKHLGELARVVSILIAEVEAE